MELGGFYAVKREALDLEHPQLHHEKFVYDLVAGGRKYILIYPIHITLTQKQIHTQLVFPSVIGMVNMMALIVS